MDTIRTKRHKKLVEILSNERRKRGLNQTAWARKLRRSQTWVTRVESNRRRIDVIEFLILCEQLELDAAKTIRKIQAVARD